VNEVWSRVREICRATSSFLRYWSDAYSRKGRSEIVKGSINCSMPTEQRLVSIAADSGVGERKR
jgi:hypothetical protein